MSSLQQSIERRNAAEKAEPSCHSVRSNAAFVDFHVSPHSRCGFPVGQLCHYTLEANEDGGDEPPERLTLAFPTADVVLLIKRFSKRAQQRNAAVAREERRLGRKLTNDEVSVVVHKTRARKLKNVPEEKVRKAQLDEIGFFEKRALRAVVAEAQGRRDG